MFSWIARESAAGLGGAVWTALWYWGLGIGLIIVCVAGAFFSPIGKQSFIIAGVAIAVALFILAQGQLVEHKICEAKIKYIYLKAHPKLNKSNLAQKWTVSPKWKLDDPVTYKDHTPPVCGELEWGCK